MVLNILAIGASLFGLIVAAVGAYLFPQFPMIWQVGLGAGILSFIGYIVLDFKNLSTLFSKRTTKYGLAAMVMSAVVFAIMVFSNLIVSNHDWRKDFTQSKSHSLSEQSLKILAGLKNDVVLKMFTGPNQKTGFEDFLSRYQYASKHVKVDYVDVFREPGLVRDYKISTMDGMNFSTIVIESEGRTSRVESIAGATDPRLEEKLTNGLIKVIKGGQRKVYFITGHVEKPLTKNTVDGLLKLKTAMEGSRYEVQELNLPKTETIPADAEILVLAGPKSQLFPHELKLLDNYLANGGKLLVMVDPESTPEMKGFLAKYGAEWNPKLTVFELNPLRQASAPIVPVVDVYDAGHEITKNFYAQSFYIMASSVEKAKSLPPEVTATSLFSTSPASFEHEVKPGARISPQDAKRKGPLSLALAITGKVKPAESKPEENKKAEKKADEAKPETKPQESPAAASKEYRMVVVGDSDFVTNQALTQGVNSDLFLNMMSWLANEEDLIAIRPKPADVRELDMTEGRFKIVVLTTFILIPLMSFVTAFAIRRTRRRR